jgi:hypothetical protein
VLKLSVRGLHAKIEPEGCSHRKLSSKVVLTLKKAESGRWYKLKK